MRSSLADNADATGRLAAEYSERADGYARHWAPVIHPIARVLLEALPLEKARHVLDVGCGTGDLSNDLRSKAPHAVLIGVDRAEGMLRVARRRISGPVLVSDAQSLALRTQSFDVAVLAFMLFHVPDPVTALREVWRVLRPDGFIGVATWGIEPSTPGTAIWTEELDACGAAADPRDAAVMGQTRMDTVDKLTGLLREPGFVPERIWGEHFAHPWTIDALLAMQTSCGVPARRLGSLSEKAQAACRGRVRSRIEALAAEDLVFRPEILFAVARRPGQSAPTSPAP